jgi:hypothetical protein
MEYSSVYHVFGSCIIHIFGLNQGAFFGRCTQVHLLMNIQFQSTIIVNAPSEFWTIERPNNV